MKRSISIERVGEGQELGFVVVSQKDVGSTHGTELQTEFDVKMDYGVFQKFLRFGEEFINSSMARRSYHEWESRDEDKSP